jgi:hypothetical protein
MGVMSVVRNVMYDLHDLKHRVSQPFPTISIKKLSRKISEKLIK